MPRNTAESPRAGLSSHKKRTAVSVASEVDDTLSVVFDLGTHDLRVYHALLDRPSATTHELAEVVGIDRSNVNRSLGRLREREFVRRRRRLLQGGRHCYIYTAIEMQKARDLLREGLDVWAERARDELRGALIPEP